MARLPLRVWVNAVGEIKTACPWDHLPSLVEKLRLALEKVIIKINCSQQRTMQCFPVCIPWLQFAVPIEIAYFVGGLALEVDGSRPQKLLNNHQQAIIVQGGQFLNSEPL